MNTVVSAFGHWQKSLWMHLIYIGCLSPRYKTLSDTPAVVGSFFFAAAVATWIRLFFSGEALPTPANFVISIGIYLAVISALSLRSDQSKVLFAVLLGTSAWTDLTATALRLLAALTDSPTTTVVPVTLLYETVMIGQAIVVFGKMPFEVRAKGYRAPKREEPVAVEPGKEDGA